MKLFACAIVPLFLTVGVVWDAHAYRYVGDLVYCDVDANGVYDAGDHPIDGVEVLVECVDHSGAICASTTTETGTIHPSVWGYYSGDDPSPERFMGFCGEYMNWDATDESTMSGRYVVELTQAGCGGAPQPWACTVTVNTATIPADCDNLVTPEVGGYPYDGNEDGDFCDAEDGPFPEGQGLGNLDYLTCNEEPDPAPSDNQYSVSVIGEACNLSNDFGYTPGTVISGATRTPGFWKNHPWAVEQQLPIEFCGETVDDVCRAVELLSTKGGGFEQFTRHAVAANLNCSAFGCPADVAATIASGYYACVAGNDFEFDYGAAGDSLDAFNNSGDDVDDDIDKTGTDSKVCKNGGFFGILPDSSQAAGCAGVPASSLALLAGLALLRRRRQA